MNRMMMAALLVAGLAVTGHGNAAAQEGPPPPRPQSVLSLDVESADWETSARGIAEALRIPAAERGPALRWALIRALEAQGMLEGPRPPDYESGAGYVGSLLRTVLAMRDPASIPALMHSPMFGSRVATALADFGPQALPVALEAATGPESHPRLISNALMTLRIMVEEWGGPEALTPEHRTTLAEVAGSYLTTEGVRADVVSSSGWRIGAIVRYAMGLAVVLGDPELRRRLEEIAADASVAEALGVTYDTSAAETQTAAARLLAGDPPLPRPRRW